MSQASKILERLEMKRKKKEAEEMEKQLKTDYVYPTLSEPKKHEPLTPEQIVNWRKILTLSFGAYALIMSDDQIQAIRDRMNEEFSQITS